MIVHFGKNQFWKTVLVNERQFLVNALHVNRVINKRNLSQLTICALFFILNYPITIIFKYLVDGQVLGNKLIQRYVKMVGNLYDGFNLWLGPVFLIRRDITTGKLENICK